MFQRSRLPNGLTFIDKDGFERKEIRIRWFEDLRGKTYFESVIPRITNKLSEDLKIEIPPEALTTQEIYPPTEKPVFFGHYWLKEETPVLLGKNVCCLDFSVAEEGFLVAYRFDGKSQLEHSNFMSCDS